MPSVSKKQQKFMGMVHACKKTGKCASKEVADTAKSMKKKDAKDFASTKHKGLPEKSKKRKKTMNGKTLNENYGFRRMLQQVVETPLGNFKVVGGKDREWDEYQIYVMKQEGNKFVKIPNSMSPTEEDEIKIVFNDIVNNIKRNPEIATNFEESNNMNKQKKLMAEFINNICEKDYSNARKVLANVVNEKIKGRIRDCAKKNG